MKKLNIHNLKAKEIKKLHTWLRALIQILYFLFLPSVYTAAFAGVKYIFTQIGAGEVIGLTSFVTVLIVLCAYTILFGRFFCGFACAFGSLGDGIHAFYIWCFKKKKKKPVLLSEKITEKLSYLKYLVLTVICSTLFCRNIWKGKRDKPVGCFFYAACRKFPFAGIFAGVILLLLIIVGMCLEERFFCQNLCPMGAVFSLLPVLPFFALHRDRENCIKGCSGCTKKCPSGIGLPEDGSLKVEGDCFQCQKCIDTCPKKHIHTGIKGLKGNEFWFTILRAILLLVIMIWAGV